MQSTSPLWIGEDVDPARNVHAFALSLRAEHAHQEIGTTLLLPMTFSGLDAAPLSMSAQGAYTKAFWFWRTQSASGFEAIPSHEREFYTIRMPLQGSMLRRAKSGDVFSPPGTATILTTEDVLKFQCSEESDILSCALDPQTLCDQYEILTGSSPTGRIAFAPLIELADMELRSLAQTLRTICERALRSDAHADLSSPLLQDVFLNQLLAAWPQLQPRPAPRTTGLPSRAVRQAVDFIEDHLGEPITVSDVARAAGTNVRTLQANFRADLDRSPVRYILDRRLERTHADLLTDDSERLVSQIAYRWGFAHMSDFSRRYRERFGCSPSETRRRYWA